MSDFRVYNDLPRMMPSTTSAGATKQQPSTAAFGKLLDEAIQQVNDVESTSQGELQKFLSNESEGGPVFSDDDAGTKQNRSGVPRNNEIAGVVIVHGRTKSARPS
jgi:hypothetical protein